MHTLPKLPYRLDALEPYISGETMDYHYTRHHGAYVAKLNELVKGTDLEDATLEAVIRASQPRRGASSALFNNAAQAWNHAFFWECLSPRACAPGPVLSEAIATNFGSREDLRLQFSATALATFGSGWTWLVADADARLEVVSTSNADTPLTQGRVPLLTCDVWEHAYYIDYRNARADYLDAFLKIINWDFVAANLRRSDQTSNAA